jgi:hypothetical protein
VTRKLTLIKGFAALGAAGLLLTACGDNDLPVPGDGDNNGGEDIEVGSYSVMLEWEGCEALDDIQPVQDFMGVTDLGTSGLVTSNIPGGLDGEAFNCGAMANLPAYHYEGSTGSKDIPGDANIDVGVAPWDSPEEAADNFQSRVDQLKETLETGGTEFLNPQEGEIEGDWDQSYYFAADKSTGYQLNAIGLKGDLVQYVFIDYTTDPGVQMDAEPVYPFTNEEFVDWVLNDYMPQTNADLLAKKESGL